MKESTCANCYKKVYCLPPAGPWVHDNGSTECFESPVAEPMPQGVIENGGHAAPAPLS